MVKSWRIYVISTIALWWLMGLVCEYAVVLTYLKMLKPAPLFTIIRPVGTVKGTASLSRIKPNISEPRIAMHIRRKSG